MQAVEVEDDAEGRLAFGPLAHSLGFLLRLAQVRNFEQFFDRFGDLDLRPGEFSVMWVIAQNPGIRQGHLARALAIKPAHMTKVIRRLEELGRLHRTIPDDDRRSVRLALSEAGEDFVETNTHAFFGLDSYHRHDLTSAEYETLTSLLKKYSGIQQWISHES